MRERLIGAIVLVVIAIIAIPWLVSRAHRPEDVVTHKSWPASASTPPKPYILPLQEKRIVASRKATSGSGTVATAHGQPTPTQSPAPKVTHTESEMPQVPAPQQQARQESASKPVTPKTPDAKKAAKFQGWSIQAASFADVKAARELAGKLKQAGFKVGLVPNSVKGTRYYQVRVGPYRSEKLARDAAPGVARISNTKVLVRAPGGDNG